MDKQKMHEIIATIREYENSVAMLARERITYRDVSGGIHLKLGDELAPKYSTYAGKCAEYLRFGYEVDAATCGELSRTNALKVCDTPALLLEAGLDDLPLLYTQKHLLDAMLPKDDYDPHRHGLTVEQVKRLPELFERPVMICDSPARPDAVLLVLNAVDCDDLPIIAAIRACGTGNYEFREIETNFILAVYGKDDFARYFSERITPDRVVYYNEERGRELSALAKLQLFRSYAAEPDLSDVIIRRPQCIVNSKAAANEPDMGCALDMEELDARDVSGAIADMRDETQLDRNVER